MGKRELPKPATTPFEKGKGFSSKTTSGDYIRGFSRGSSLIEEGKYMEAEKILWETAERFKDDNVLAVVLLADALFFQNRFDEAEELYRACAPHDYITVHARHGLALVLRKNGKDKEAKMNEELVRQLSSLSFGQKVPEYLPPL